MYECRAPESNNVQQLRFPTRIPLRIRPMTSFTLDWLSLCKTTIADVPAATKAGITLADNVIIVVVPQTQVKLLSGSVFEKTRGDGSHFCSSACVLTEVYIKMAPIWLSSFRADG